MGIFVLSNFLHLLKTRNRCIHIHISRDEAENVNKDLLYLLLINIFINNIRMLINVYYIYY